jgi:hypothetical protein
MEVYVSAAAEESAGAFLRKQPFWLASSTSARHTYHWHSSAASQAAAQLAAEAAEAAAARAAAETVMVS